MRTTTRFAMVAFAVLPLAACGLFVDYEGYHVADGWLVIAVGSEKLWHAFCGVLGLDIAADPRCGRVLLHAGVLGVEAFDGAGMIAGDDGSNELIETGARRHGASSNSN